MTGEKTGHSANTGQKLSQPIIAVAKKHLETIFNPKNNDRLNVQYWSNSKFVVYVKSVSVIELRDADDLGFKLHDIITCTTDHYRPSSFELHFIFNEQKSPHNSGFFTEKVSSIFGSKNVNIDLDTGNITLYIDIIHPSQLKAVNDIGYKLQMISTIDTKHDMKVVLEEIVSYE